MAKEPYPSETADRYIVRFPDGMRERLKQAAADNNRSMNAEIISRLEASFGMDIPLVQGTVNTIQGVRQMAAQMDKALKALETNPNFMAFMEQAAQKRQKEIAPQDNNKPEDK